MGIRNSANWWQKFKHFHPEIGLVLEIVRTANDARMLHRNIRRNRMKTANYPDWLISDYNRYFDVLDEGEEALSIDEYAECLGFKVKEGTGE